MTVRLGLIGAGRMGKVYAETLAFGVPDVNIAAVAEPSSDALNEVMKRYRIPHGYNDYRELLDSKEIDAVIVATPTGTHARVVMDAAAAGKHIFCEKPLSQNLRECGEAIRCVKDAGVKLQMGFMRRFDPAYRDAYQKIKDGVIGEPVMFKATSRDPKRTSLEFARRENSGGMIVDMGVHDFDLARWLMGAEVELVHSLGACLAFPELKDVGDIDNAVVNLSFANNAVGNIDISRNAVYGYDIRTEVLGTQGSLQIGYLQQTAVLSLTRQGVTHDTVPYFMERFATAYAEEVRVFVRHIVDDTAPDVTGEDARAATAIGIAATRSLDESRPIKLSEIS